MASLSQGFGGDVSIDGGGSSLSHMDPPLDNICTCSRDQADKDYAAGVPRATYTPGQKVCVAYPARQHVAASCFNLGVPDAGVQFFRSAKDPAAVLALNDFEREYPHNNGVHEAGKEDHKGFQRVRRSQAHAAQDFSVELLRACEAVRTYTSC